MSVGGRASVCVLEGGERGWPEFGREMFRQIWSGQAQQEVGRPKWKAKWTHRGSWGTLVQLGPRKSGYIQAWPAWEERGRGGEGNGGKGRERGAFGRSGPHS